MKARIHVLACPRAGGEMLRRAAWPLPPRWSSSGGNPRKWPSVGPAPITRRAHMMRTMIFAATLLSASAAVAAPPAVFLRDAIQGNYSEVALGRMVQNRAVSPDVRRFGAMLVRDHSKSLAQAQHIARRLHLRIPARLSPEARAEQHRLQTLRGRDFDREVRR